MRALFDAKLLPGDCLCYRGTGLLSFIIRQKTWSDISHVEIALNEHYAITSKEGGVKLYPFTDREIFAVLRPDGPLDFGAANRWFTSVIGQPYDPLSLLGFYNIAGNMNGMHCAETVTGWYRAAHFEPFSPDYPAVKVSPGMYLTTPRLKLIWHA